MRKEGDCITKQFCDACWEEFNEDCKRIREKEREENEKTPKSGVDTGTEADFDNESSERRMDEQRQRESTTRVNNWTTRQTNRTITEYKGEEKKDSESTGFRSASEVWKDRLRMTRNRRERDKKADRSSVKALKDAEESINDSDAVILKHRVQDKGDQLPEDDLQLLINNQAWVLLVDSGTSMSTLTEGSLNILSAFTEFDIEPLTTPYVVTQASGDAVMVSKLARNCTIVLSTGDKKVILPNMTIQIIP